MTTVSVSRTIKAPAAKVWAMVSEWGGTHKWIPGVGPVTVEGAGVGSIRSADLDPATGFPGRIAERLETLDPAAMHFSYCVVGKSPIPISDYVAEMKVTAQGADVSEVTWRSSWQASGAISEADLKTAFEGLYGLSLENVAGALE
jgi:carbon monoxide dehydrogenase subunit G